MELLIIPFLFALLSLLIPRKVMRPFAIIGALLSLGVALSHLCHYDPELSVTLFNPDFITSFGLTFEMGYDGIGLVMVLLTNVVVLIILLSNYDLENTSTNKLFNSMIFFMQFALIGVFLSMDGLLFYIFWELALVPVFLLFFWFGAADRRKAMMKFFIYTFVGSLAMLFSLLYIGSMSASFAWIDLVSVDMDVKAALCVAMGFFIAFAVKVPLFPFHTWQPEAYTKSPLAGTMLLSALMLKMALYGMMRWLLPLTPEALPCLKYIGMTLGVIGVIYAAIIAIKQDDIKKLFAYASISHVGLIAAGIFVTQSDVWAGAMVQIVNHSLVAVGLFLSADIIDRRLGTRSLKELGGIAQQAPQFAFWFACIIFAGISVPLTSGFIGEFLLIRGIYLDSNVLGILVGTTLILACVYSFRAYQVSMFGATKSFNFPDLTKMEWISFFIIMVLVVFLGIYPQALISVIEPSINNLLIHSIK